MDHRRTLPAVPDQVRRVAEQIRREREKTGKSLARLADEAGLSKAYLVKAKGALVEVEFHGGNAAAQKDKLIAILKTVAAAL